MNNIIDAGLGVGIGTVTKEAIKTLKEGSHTDGKIKMNGLMIPFSVDSDPDDIAIIYTLMHRVRDLETKLKEKG